MTHGWRALQDAIRCASLSRREWQGRIAACPGRLGRLSPILALLRLDCQRLALDGVNGQDRLVDTGAVALPDARPPYVDPHAWRLLVRHIRQGVPTAALAREVGVAGRAVGYRVERLLAQLPVPAAVACPAHRRLHRPAAIAAAPNEALLAVPGLDQAMQGSAGPGAVPRRCPRPGGLGGAQPQLAQAGDHRPARGQQPPADQQPPQLEHAEGVPLGSGATSVLRIVGSGYTAPGIPGSLLRALVLLPDATASTSGMPRSERRVERCRTTSRA